MKPHPDVLIPEGTTKEERARILARARYKRNYHNNKNKDKERTKRNRANASKKYYEKNKEKCKLSAVEWAIKNRELVKQRSKKKSKEYAQRYYTKNKQKRANANKEWRQKNKDKHREIIKKYIKNRKLRDPIFVIKEKLRASVRASFRRIKFNKFAETEKLLGCTWQEAKNYIENLWQEGMSWENHGNGPKTWNIDHIRPVTSFTEADLQLMNKIENLQPLWWEENSKKSDQW